jgi:histidinol-phosphatase (PHP family)
MKGKEIKYNLHQHTIFSDGKETPQKFVERAIELDFSQIGFSEHSPLPFPNPFSLKEENIDAYISSVEQLKEQFARQIEIYRALEMDYIPGISENFDHWRDRCKVDYLIGSVHLVKPGVTDELWFTDGPDHKIYDEGLQQFFGGDIRKAVKAFYDQTNRMIESQTFEIVGHLDKIKMHNRGRFFSEDEKWYRNLLEETLELVKQKNLIVEVNTRGMYKKTSDSLFPDHQTLKRVQELNIPVIISSDAHHPDEINNLFDHAVKRLVEFGFQEVMMLENGIWIAKSLI